MYVASGSRQISLVSGCFDCFDWLPKKIQDSRSEWIRIFRTRPYICRPRARGITGRMPVILPGNNWCPAVIVSKTVNFLFTQD